MKIEVGNFTLISVEDRFDLIQTRAVNKKDKDTRELTGEVGEREVVIGYNMEFETCINKIAKLNLNDQDITVKPETYVKMYREEREKIMNILK